jgi:hypothetical protein
MWHDPCSKGAGRERAAMDDDLSYLNTVAHNDFEKAHERVFLNDVAAFLQGRGNQLLSYDEVRAMLPITGQVERGLQQVPLNAIRGSVDRYRDFDSEFLPRNRATRERWERLDRMALAGKYVPPIQLYKVGDIYFVKDGNHRVSVARQQGATDIEAEVIECTTNVPVHSDADLRDLLRLAEYGRFLQQTNLDKLRPGAHIMFTSLGRYDELLEHISAHRWYLGIEYQRPVAWEEAVLSWYDRLYKPLTDLIMASGILRDFPGHTPADLYIWIMDHRYYLSLEQGHPVGNRTALLSYDAQYGSWPRRVHRFLARLIKQARQPLVITHRLLRRALLSLAAHEPPLLPLLPPQAAAPQDAEATITISNPSKQ